MPTLFRLLLCRLCGVCFVSASLLPSLCHAQQDAEGQVPTEHDHLVRPDNPAADPDRWLTEDRWSELRYGLTIRQPKDATLFEQTRDGANARWIMPDGSKISLTINRGVHYMKDRRGNVRQEKVHLNTVVAQVTATLMASGAADATKESLIHIDAGRAGRVYNTRSDQWIKVGDLLGWHNYFVIVPTGQADPTFFGIGVLQLDDTSLMVLRLECSPVTLKESVSTYESMLQSVQVEPAGQAVQRIKGWVDNGQQFLDSISPEQYQQAMIDDRLYRITEDGKDIGFQRVWMRHQDNAYYDTLERKIKRQNPDARLQGIDSFRLKGNALVIQAHYEAGGIEIDSLQEHLDEYDSINEYWQLKTNLSEPDNPRSRIAGAWVETGIRGEANFRDHQVDQIQVQREGTPPRQIAEFVLSREKDPARRLRFPSSRPDMYPSGEKSSHSWATPPRAYLSQVDRWVIPALLPAEEKTYAFFAYHPESTAVALKIMTVQPKPGGGKVVYLRPTIDLAEQKLEYDANNELVRWTFHDGRVMQRTTREELNRIWRRR